MIPEDRIVRGDATSVPEPLNKLDEGIRCVTYGSTNASRGFDSFDVSFYLQKEEWEELKWLIENRKFLRTASWRLNEVVNVLKAAVSNCKYTMSSWRNKYAYGRGDAMATIEEVRFGTVCLALDVATGEAVLGGKAKAEVASAANNWSPAGTATTYCKFCSRDSDACAADPCVGSGRKRQ